MAKTRSPSYPSISLKEAVEKATDIYRQNYQSPVSRAVAAELMGYQGLNGKSLGVLAALSKYGLLEGRGDDTRVSDLALRIIAHEPGTIERAQAVQEAGAKPELFAELDSRFNGGKASDPAIRSYLLTQKFIPLAADAVVRAYRETKQYVVTEANGLVVDEEGLGDPQFRADSDHIEGVQKREHPLPTGWAEMDDPYEISISGNSKAGKKITGRFSFTDQDSVDELVGILQAMKLQLPKRQADVFE